MAIISSVNKDRTRLNLQEYLQHMCTKALRREKPQLIMRVLYSGTHHILGRLIFVD